MALTLALRRVVRRGDTVIAAMAFVARAMTLLVFVIRLFRGARLLRTGFSSGAWSRAGDRGDGSVRSLERLRGRDSWTRF